MAGAIVPLRLSAWLVWAAVPLIPALSLGERVNPSLRGEQSRLVGFPLCDARYSLSLRERVRVKGNDAT